VEDATRLSRCSQCGAELSPDAAEGLCPACLLAAAAGGSDLSGNDATVLSGGEGGAPGRRPWLVPGQPFGPYRIERLLGRGGMGDVYEAEHVEQGRRVALKLLNQRLAGAEDRARFLREGQLAASINHPHTVYIFGSEEIAGTPVISMELLPGGTLKDRVQHGGPLTPPHAVDAIVQVIAGLEAAHAAGILHRDIKPANCFTDRDGTVKVGDFGLSISTSARDLSVLGVGAFQGTPQFASPEQLRGDALDVRADIYAVGVTLYYLLTAQLPFNDGDLTTLVTRVKGELAPSPRSIAPRIPNGLARIVLQCLAKDRANRFQTYAALEDRLRSFGSAAPTPATLGLRFLASAIDQTILSVPVVLVTFIVMFGNERFGLWDWTLPLQVALFASYYGIQEGLWGAAVGKRVFGLRVTNAGGQPPGIARAAGRALIFGTPAFLYTLVILGLGPERTLELSRQSPLAVTALGWMPWAVIGLLFSTARRRNGFAGVHELATGTRVIRRSQRNVRPAFNLAVPPAPAPGTTVESYGPYEVGATLGPSDVDDLRLAFDPSLRRPVWIHVLPAGTAAIQPLIRDLSRPARLRWLNGRRSGAIAWDAYEAPDGAPFVTVLNRTQPWRRVKYWLHDLAVEIDAAQSDGSLPALALDRVWITPDGHARLLDFRAPGVRSTAAQDSATPSIAAQQFLALVTSSALSGRVTAGVGPHTAGFQPLPLRAQSFVQRLTRGAFSSTREVRTEIGTLLVAADGLARWRRAAAVLLCGLGPALGALGFGVMLAVMQHASPEVQELATSLRYLAGLRLTGGDTAREQAALEVYIVSRFGPMLADEKTWNNPFTAGQLQLTPTAAKQLLADHPSVSPEDLARAEPALRSFHDFQRQWAKTQRDMSASPWVIPTMIFTICLACVGALSVAAAGLFRSGVLLRLFGIAIVTTGGERASRLRTLWRALLAWAPLAGCIYFAFISRPSLTWERHPAALTALAVSGALFVGGAMVSIWRPERGLQDRLAGTWLVRR